LERLSDTIVAGEGTLKEMIALPDRDVIAPLDVGTLAHLSAIQRNGRPGFMDQVITLFLLTAPSMIRELQVGAGVNDAIALHRVSHSLRSCSAVVGALSLASLCEALEAMARCGSVSDANTRIGAIAREYNRVEAALTGSGLMLR
jgi:HPt (histidine-containing phosphotransfer) domain-containing protein